jgi:hypothetical protein
VQEVNDQRVDRDGISEEDRVKLVMADKLVSSSDTLLL